MRDTPPIVLIVALKSQSNIAYPTLYFSFLTPLNGSLSAFWSINHIASHPPINTSGAGSDPSPQRGEGKIGGGAFFAIKNHPSPSSSSHEGRGEKIIQLNQLKHKKKGLSRNLFCNRKNTGQAWKTNFSLAIVSFCHYDMKHYDSIL